MLRTLRDLFDKCRRTMRSYPSSNKVVTVTDHLAKEMAKSGECASEYFDRLPPEKAADIKARLSTRSRAAAAMLQGTSAPSRERVQQLEILQDVISESLLGRGVSGVVMRGLWEGTTPVAMKTAGGKEHFETVLHEASLLRSLRHPNIVQLFGVSLENETMYLVTELCLGSILDLMKDGQPLPLWQQVLIARDVCAGMNYLSINGVVHRDLAARNVLYELGESSRVIAKVSDFGLSQLRRAQSYIMAKSTDVVPTRWMAPESINERIWSEKSDVWSMGVLLWELSTGGRQPWTGMRNYEVATKVSAGEVLPQPYGCPDGLYGIMRQCWTFERDLRPTLVCIFLLFVEKIFVVEIEVVGADVRFQLWGLLLVLAFILFVKQLVVLELCQLVVVQLRLVIVCFALLSLGRRLRLWFFLILVLVEFPEVVLIFVRKIQSLVVEGSVVVIWGLLFRLWLILG
eukprot:m51a1_g11721 putative tyrosine-protein kinase frk (458) ;mRNA; f:98098-100996